HRDQRHHPYQQPPHELHKTPLYLPSPSTSTQVLKLALTDETSRPTHCDIAQLLTAPAAVNDSRGPLLSSEALHASLFLSFCGDGPGHRRGLGCRRLRDAIR